MADKNMGQQEGAGNTVRENMVNQKDNRVDKGQHVDMETGGEQTGSGQTTRQGGQGGQQRTHDGKGSGQSSRAPGRNS